MRNVADKGFMENKKKSVVFTFFLFFENLAVYDTMWKNIVERGRPQIIQRMHIECWITLATNTRSEYVMLITFPLQHWLQELP